MVIKLFVVFLGLGIAQAQEVVSNDAEAVKPVVQAQRQDLNRHLAGQTWQPWAQEQMRGQAYLPGQTWQPWAQNPQQNQFLPGQTWQPWAQPARNRHLRGQVWQPWAQNQFLGGQTWQPWAQPANNMPLSGQVWQPWAQPARESRPAKLVQYSGDQNNFQSEFSPLALSGEMSGVFPMETTWNNMPSTDPVWNMPAETYPISNDKEDKKVEESPKMSQDPNVFVPGAPTWRKSWTPMPGKKPGCFNRCKNRCGKGFGNEYGCRPSCRSGCNLKPNCGKAAGKMVGNTMVCPFSKQNNNKNMVNKDFYLPGQTWQSWAQPINQPNYMSQYNFNMESPSNKISASVEIDDPEPSGDISQDNTAYVEKDLEVEE